MSNVRFGNTFFIDTQYASAGDELASKNLKLKGIIFAPLSTSATLLLTDSSSNSKLYIQGDTAGRTLHLNFSDCPITFADSIRPTTLTNAKVTCIIEETKA